MTLPAQVLSLTDTFLTLVDSALPGMIQGLYLVGSIALDDFQSHCSDVDFVAILGNPARLQQLDSLADTHGAIHTQFPAHHFDGIYLTRSDLAAGPDACGLTPSCFEGTFERAGRFELNPVTWHELAEYRIALREPDAGNLTIWRDHTVLRTWTLANLVDYWRPWLTQYDDAPARVDVLDDPIVWGVLGVTRLHYTLATGKITSKSGAGLYALQCFGRWWTPIVTEALQIRREPNATTNYTSLAQRRRDAVAFVDMVIESAKDLP